MARVRSVRAGLGLLAAVLVLPLLGPGSAGATTNGAISGVAFIDCEIVLQSFPAPFPTRAVNNCDGLAVGALSYVSLGGQAGTLTGNHNPPKSDKPLIDPLWKLGLDKPPVSTVPSKQEPWHNFHAFDIDYGETCAANAGPAPVGNAEGNATLYLNSVADAKTITKGGLEHKYTLVIGHTGGPGFNYLRVGNFALVRVFDAGLYKGKLAKKTIPGKSSAKVSMQSPAPGVVPIGVGVFKFIPRVDKSIPGNCADFPNGPPAKVQVKGVVALDP